jgi:hypothetical protein
LSPSVDDGPLLPLSVLSSVAVTAWPPARVASFPPPAAALLPRLALVLPAAAARVPV